MQKKVLLITSFFFVFVILIGGGVFLYYRMSSTPTSLYPMDTVTDSTLPTASLTPSPSPYQLSATVSAILGTDAPKAPAITDIVITDAADATVVAPSQSKTQLPATTSTIKIAVWLNPESTAERVALKLTYIADDSVLGPATATVKTVNQRKLATFSMTKPTNGWPNGPYTLQVVLLRVKHKRLS
jgi:hypothetical protein